jgi:hypothetical protein
VPAHVLDISEQTDEGKNWKYKNYPKTVSRENNMTILKSYALISLETVLMKP